LPETKAVSLGKRLFELPIIVLVGSKTAGAGEVFTSLISSSPSVIVAGNSTCGRPFEKKVIKLKDGGRLLIPFDPDYLDTISKEKIIPGLKISNGKQADYEDISQNTDKAKEDKCLTRSQDILISVQKLKNKKLKNPGSK
jgi:C-terminal processing protease CtpA/Prc